MAESELVTKDDSEQLSTALQLKPHEKNTEFTSVTKTEVGDLVSLDELYEKTGQESIALALDGYRKLLKSNKLSRAHGLLLNVEGAETWMELPDRSNAIQGKEGFFSTISKGFVAIVKAIISFIKGLCNWIYTRIKALFGFGETAKETKFIKEHSDALKVFSAKFFNELGIVGFDPQEYINSLPDNITRTKAFTITKKRIEQNSDSFERLKEASKYLNGYQDEINGWYRGIKLARINYTRLMNNIKQKIRSKNINKADITEVTLGLGDILREQLNPTKPVAYLNGLTTLLYDVDVDGLGMTTSLKKTRDELTAVSEKARLTYNKKLHEELRALSGVVYTNLYGGANINERRIKRDIVEGLKNMIDEKDSEFIKVLDETFPEASIKPVYLEYCNTVSAMADVIELTLKVIQSAEISINNIIRWECEINDLIIAYITNDMITILEAHKKLTPEQRARLENEGVPRYLEDLHIVFMKKYPGMHLPERISDFFDSFSKTDMGKAILKNIDRFKSQFRG